jgi:heat shock protein HslJ
MRSWRQSLPRSAITILLAGVVTGSCHSTRSPDPPAGTTWRLVEIQSMDDAVGTKRPADPSRYTMRLDADGTVAMRLDCNRATSTWSAEHGGDSSGRFEFGPLAATRAICLPPTMGEELAAQAKFVRSYVLKDERLPTDAPPQGRRCLTGEFVFRDGIPLEPGG